MNSNVITIKTQNTNIVSVNQDGDTVTTSLAIAEGVGNPHASVIRLIRDNLSDLEEFGRVGFEIRPFETAGGVQNREISILNEQQSTLLLTYLRNNEIVREFKKQLVKSFYEMREKLRAPAFDPSKLSKIDILKMAIESEEENQKLTAQVQEMKTDVEALERISKADGSLCVTDAAKTLQMRPKDLFRWLHAHDWIYKKSSCSHWTAKAVKLQQDCLEHKTTVVSRTDGSEKTVQQVRVTPRGLTKLAKLIKAEVA